MAHFSSPCQRSVIFKTDAAPMPTLVESTYMIDYITPSVRRSTVARLLNPKPPDYLDESAGKRILPTTFRHIYQNCVSASIGDRLELQFTDDTPEWKRLNRAAAAAHWIQPLAERRKFVETQRKKAREEGGDSAGGGSAQNDGGDAGAGYDCMVGGETTMDDAQYQYTGGDGGGDINMDGGEGIIEGFVDGQITEVQHGDVDTNACGFQGNVPCH